MDASGDTSRRFGGIERLYGGGALARLAGAHVCVIGIGGVGSWAAEALARSGVGRLTLIDLDHVAESNLNRQVHALEATLGQAKVLAMRERIAGIHPACTVDVIEAFIDADNVARLVPDCDAVIDAIDNVRAKAALIAHCRRARRAVVTTGGAGGRLDPTRVEVDDLARTTQDALASKTRALLRKAYGFPRDAKKKFGVACVFSQESIHRPAAATAHSGGGPVAGGGTASVRGMRRGVDNLGSVDRRPATTGVCATDAPALDGAAGLACAGYGSSMAVTAAFGLAAAARVIDRLVKAPA